VEKPDFNDIPVVNGASKRPFTLRADRGMPALPGDPVWQVSPRSGEASCKLIYMFVLTVLYLTLFHRRTRASYVYNVCLAWYNVVLTHGSTQA